MPTRYPTNLPPVPEDRWNPKQVGQSTHGIGFAQTTYEIDATTDAEAEVRILAWIDHDAEDDLRGATAEAAEQLSSTRWRVTLMILGEF
ncbi:hypothetical protein [Streptomyces sp. NPDC051572]|jgi:hypothetical protein|uniref:hypothetical protein n=1 Tax=Streptomyces sp. NPDC051572 TaxID=3155802 RepID=UPI00344B019D